VLHLADLDPVPTDLDLVVDSADVHVVPVRLKPNVVPVAHMRSPGLSANGSGRNEAAVRPGWPR